MNGLLKYEYATPSSTGVAHDNIDLHINNDYYNKKLQDAQDTLTRSNATIGPVVAFEDTELGGSILDMVMDSAMPGVAIGKIAKARLTGGHMARTGPKYWNEMIKAKEEDILGQIKDNNSLSNAKILVEKAFKKWGIKPQNAEGMKDSYERHLMDPISEILRTSKYKQN